MKSVETTIPKELGKRFVAILGSTFLSGLLLFLALPSVHPFLGEQWWIAWFALVPVLVAIRKSRFIFGFGAGLAIGGIAAFLVLQVAHQQKSFGESAWIVTSLMTYGVILGITLGVYAEQKKNELPPVWFACLAVAIESLSFFQIPTQFAVTQYRNLAALQIASLGGIFLVTWLVWWFNLWIAEDWKRSKSLVVFVCVCVGVNALIGSLPRSKEVIRVGLNQHDTSDEKGLLTGQEEAVQLRADVVVWPEFGGMAFQRGDDVSMLAKLAKETVPFITSYPERTRARGGRPFNTARLFTESGTSAPYDKRKLFGSESRMHSAGDQPVTAQLGNLRIGLSICYDSCFPELMRASSKGADFIALPTIDPPSSGTFMAVQHAAFTPFRSAENGISMVRVDGEQSSMVTDSWGRIVAELKAPSNFKVAEVPTDRRWTLFSLVGSLVLYVAIAGVLLLPVFRAVRKAQQLERTEEERLKEFVSNSR
jgi:apolipoprotein N-acyltransferase